MKDDDDMNFLGLFVSELCDSEVLYQHLICDFDVWILDMVFGESGERMVVVGGDELDYVSTCMLDTCNDCYV